MSIDTAYGTLHKALSEPDLFGWAVEFGVYSGFSLSMIAQRMPVIGFDSFEGLPEDWRPGFPKGKFKPRFPALPHHPNAMLVPGWFEDTAPTFPFPRLGLVHIDCDLYSSTVTALESVVDHIEVGTLIVFDEFHGYPGSEQHEEKAWDEFRAKYLITADLIATGPEEAAFRIEDIGERP